MPASSVPQVIQFYLPRTPDERMKWSDQGRQAEAKLLAWIYKFPNHFRLSDDGYWYFYPENGVPSHGGKTGP
jgi:hypothetical protein